MYTSILEKITSNAYSTHRGIQVVETIVLYGKLLPKVVLPQVTFLCKMSVKDKKWNGIMTRERIEFN